MGTRIHAHPIDPYAEEQSYDVYIFDKKIRTTVTTFPEAVDEWILEIDVDTLCNPQRLIVGLDVMKSPTHDRIVTLHLCNFRSCLIYQMYESAARPPSLREFLEDQNNVFVGVGIKSKLDQLQHQYGFGGNARYVDLANRAAENYNRPELNNAGVSDLAMFLFGRAAEKPQITYTWDDLELTDEQVHYACIDTFTAYDIGTVLVMPTQKDT